MGIVRRDPFAMLPFIGYNMSDYFAHWLNMGAQIEKTGATLPKIFCVNWFRTDSDGKFVWPGFGDNMRVLSWMLDRVEGKAGGVENVFGTTPRYADLNWDGIEFTQQQFETITSVDKNAWLEEVGLHSELFDKLQHNMPQQLRDTKTSLTERLSA
jgi:phosphoenolpyruvate carboxykinase (GTP)